jgi:predicted Fe-Mo cluster-binding NifX family protein
MLLAVPSLNERVSPVFDVAQTIVLSETRTDREVRRHAVPLHARDIPHRVGEVVALGVHVLICGAISRPLEAALRAAGVCVIPQTCGAVDEVLQAYRDGHLDDPVFWMPGCCGRRRAGWCGGRGRHGRQGSTRRADEQT